MSEISAKTCLGLHLEFTLFVCDLGQNVNVSTVKLPNVISYENVLRVYLFIYF